MPTKFSSPVTVIGISPLHSIFQVALFPTRWKSLVTQVLSPPGGGWVHSLAVQSLDVMAGIAAFESEHQFREKMAGAHAHFLGTSGTVTTISGIHLKLPVYERSKVDGCWLSAQDVRKVSDDLIAMSYGERIAQPCIGQERADLVLAGCAILEALLRTWPCQRLRVADRGLREGILATLMAEDGHDRRAYRQGRG